MQLVDRATQVRPPVGIRERRTQRVESDARVSGETIRRECQGKTVQFGQSWIMAISNRFPTVNPPGGIEQTTQICTRRVCLPELADGSRSSIALADPTISAICFTQNSSEI